MRCAEMMKTEIECVSMQDTVADAASCMRDKNIGFLPVCDDSGVAQGTLTDRDIAVRVVAEQMPGSTPVGDVMSREVIACRPDDDLGEVERLMSSHQKSRILCVDDEQRPVGVISLSDIARQEVDGQASRLLRDICEREVRSEASRSSPI